MSIHIIKKCSKYLCYSENPSIPLNYLIKILDKVTVLENIYTDNAYQVLLISVGNSLKISIEVKRFEKICHEYYDQSNKEPEKIDENVKKIESIYESLSNEVIVKCEEIYKYFIKMIKQIKTDKENVEKNFINKCEKYFLELEKYDVKLGKIYKVNDKIKSKYYGLSAELKQLHKPIYLFIINVLNKKLTLFYSTICQNMTIKTFSIEGIVKLNNAILENRKEFLKVYS